MAAGKDDGCAVLEKHLGDAQSASELFPVIYEQLRQLARRRMAAERASHTFQPTELVHEVYLRLVGDAHVAWAGRTHFFCAAAEAMRRILIEHARKHGQAKRGGHLKRLPLSAVALMTEEHLPDLLAVDEAITRLEAMAPEVASVVRLRFYGGLSVDQTAEALGTSARTVKREWTYARATLWRMLRGK